MIRLVPADLRLLEAALAGDDRLAETLGHAVVPGWASFTEALEATRRSVAADPGAVLWGPRFFVAADPPELVGWGGFKGAPSNGLVEIGYEIAERRRRQGLATAAAQAMVAAAFADDRVVTIRAHTLPEANPSNHLLENLGFHFDGEVTDDGEVVWRFVLDRPAAAAP